MNPHCKIGIKKWKQITLVSKSNPNIAVQFPMPDNNVTLTWFYNMMALSDEEFPFEHCYMSSVRKYGDLETTDMEPKIHYSKIGFRP